MKNMYWCLAPMDGITDTSYRQIVKKVFKKYNKDKTRELLLFTEFVSSDGYVHNFDGIKDHLVFENEEKPLICQIFGSNLQKLVYTAKEIDKNYNFDGIELNIGCPSPKIMRLGAGSALMLDKENTLNIIKILSESVNKPFSIKTRSGVNEQDKEKQKDFIIKASKYCSMISIHSRTLKQEHSGDVDLDFVLDVKNKVDKNCKIIFNGWINFDTLQNEDFLQKVSSLDGIMIGQWAIWNPWIFTDYIPSWDEKKQIIIEHINLNVKYKWERRWVVEFRKFVGSYIKWIDNASKYRVELMKTEKLDEFIKIIEKI